MAMLGEMVFKNSGAVDITNAVVTAAERTTLLCWNATSAFIIHAERALELDADTGYSKLSVAWALNAGDLTSSLKTM